MLLFFEIYVVDDLKVNVDFYGVGFVVIRFKLCRMMMNRIIYVVRLGYREEFEMLCIILLYICCFLLIFEIVIG